MIKSCFFILSVSAPSCQNVISSIPDLSARLCLYNMSLHEPLISDHLLREGWYRTDDHHIPTIGNGATTNSCGSSYPIVVKGKSLNRKILWCCHILTDKGCGRKTH